MMRFCEVSRALLVLVMFVNTVVSNHLPSDNNQPSIPPDQLFKQYLDHFTITDNRQWNQRYQVLLDYYKPGGPVFIVIGGMNSIEENLHDLTATVLAKEFNGLVFQLERRFYGKSHPTSDVSTDNLIYLSTSQMLADIAYFINGMNLKYNLPKGTKWIAFGGSLAVWARDKYSHLVYAAVADSASLEAKVDFYEFLNGVQERLSAYNPACVTKIQEAHKKLTELVETLAGQSIITKKFKLPEPITPTRRNVFSYFLRGLSVTYSNIVLYSDSVGMDTKKACDILLDDTLGDVLDRYAKVHNMVEEVIKSPATENQYDVMIKNMQKTSWNDDVATSGTRQYYYQLCTEYGFFQTSARQTDLFLDDIPEDLYIKQCTDIFGDKFNKDLVYKGEYLTNTFYGGSNCLATRVAYVYSKDDPWATLGESGTPPAESTIILLEGTATEAFTYKLPEDASESLKGAWHQVEDIVGRWCKG